MKACLGLMLGLCMLASFSDAVTVTVDNFSFPLELVKKLKDLLKEERAMQPRMRSSVPLCHHPDLPKEFVPICANPKTAAQMFQKLGAIASEPEVCEICANVACSGC